MARLARKVGKLQSSASEAAEREAHLQRQIQALEER
jgi:hypothetical protein